MTTPPTHAATFAGARGIAPGSGRSGSDPVVRTEALTKRYPGSGERPPAVDHLDLHVRAGEIFGLLGPNGAGKTTTIGMLTTGVVPTSGAAFIAGLDVVKQPTDVKRLIGVVSQANTLDRSLSVYKNLYYHGRYFAWPAAEARSEAERLLELFHLADRRDAAVGSLSGGMAQRLMVARAVMHRPSVLFLDEPTTGLDPQSRLDLWDLLRALNASGQTVLLTTHNMDEADQLCHRIAIMDHGQILALDTPAGLKASVDADTVITVAAHAPAGRIEAAVGAVDGVVKVVPVADAVQIHVQGGRQGILTRIFTAADDHGIAVSDLSIAEPSLETVFIALTGKELRD
ncbi:MAG: ATP-binding cassette domain-containing protein [Streptosporangiaceae bacterium]